MPRLRQKLRSCEGILPTQGFLYDQLGKMLHDEEANKTLTLAFMAGSQAKVSLLRRQVEDRLVEIFDAALAQLDTLRAGGEDGVWGSISRGVPWAQPLPPTTVKTMARHLISARMLHLRNGDLSETTGLAAKVDEFLAAAAARGLVYVAQTAGAAPGFVPMDPFTVGQKRAFETQTADLSDEEDNDEDNDEEKDGDDKALIRVLKKAATAHGNSQPTALTVETVDNLSRKLQTSSLNQSAPQPAPATPTFAITARQITLVRRPRRQPQA